MANRGSRTYNGFAIAALRRKSNLHRGPFAANVGIGTPHLSNIEAGRRQPSDELAMKMGATLGLDDLRAIVCEPLGERIPVEPLEVD